MKNAATILFLAAALAFAACGKDKGNSGRKPVSESGPKSAPASNADGRRVEIEVKKTGYVPARVEAAASEKLLLVFTRTEETECGRYVKVGGDTKTTELPLNEPVEIAFTMPAKGEAPFTCQMDMMKGVLAVAN